MTKGNGNKENEWINTLKKEKIKEIQRQKENRRK